MEESTNTKPNILLKRNEEQELRIYFFIGDRPNPFPIPGQRPQAERKVIYVAGFKLEEAFEVAKRKGDGYNLLFTAQNPTVSKFLRELELESLTQELLEKSMPVVSQDPLPQPAVERPQQSKAGFESFRAGLIFAANEDGVVYENPEDQKVLKRIISGLRYEPLK